jgi:hypothetical protein
MLKTCAKDTEINLKARISQSKIEIASIKKEHTRSELSKNKFKNECKSLKAEVKFLRNELLKQGIKLDERRAKQHQFAIALVLFCVQCQSYGTMSLRSCRHSVIQLQLAFGLSFKVPSHTTIRNWCCKCGYYRSVEPLDENFDTDQNWAVWIDESIMMGGQKLLVILGYPIREKFKEVAPSLKDVHMLHISIACQWTGESILEELKAVNKKYKIGYVVSDEGNNLKKCYRLGDFTHISDLTHTIANSLEAIYKKDTQFINLMGACTNLRKKWNLSLKKCAYMPPSQRGKVRFANIFPTIKWAYEILKIQKKIPEEIMLELEFVNKNKKLIMELYLINQAIAQLNELLKNKGFSLTNKAEAELILQNLPHTNSTQRFEKSIKTWLETTELARKKTNLKTIFCCSDIIESTFGKFKNKININSPFGMTEFVLTIANFGKDFSKKEIKSALEDVTLEKIKDWRPKENSIVKNKWSIFGKKTRKKKAQNC